MSMITIKFSLYGMMVLYNICIYLSCHVFLLSIVCRSAAYRLASTTSMYIIVHQYCPVAKRICPLGPSERLKESLRVYL